MSATERVLAFAESPRHPDLIVKDARVIALTPMEQSGIAVRTG
jgi:hypothetical protein